MTPAAPSRRAIGPAERAFRRHADQCRDGWCRECAQFARQADIESGRRHGWETDWRGER